MAPLWCFLAYTRHARRGARTALQHDQLTFADHDLHSGCVRLPFCSATPSIAAPRQDCQPRCGPRGRVILLQLPVLRCGAARHLLFCMTHAGTLGSRWTTGDRSGHVCSASRFQREPSMACATVTVRPCWSQPDGFGAVASGTGARCPGRHRRHHPGARTASTGEQPPLTTVQDPPGIEQQRPSAAWQILRHRPGSARRPS